jgi:hypothetical protein
LALNAGATFAEGQREVAQLKFAASEKAGGVTVAFTDVPIIREVASPQARALASNWPDVTIAVLAPELSFARVETAEGSRLELRWPAYLNGSLTSANSVTGGAWLAVSGTPVRDGDFLTLTVSMTQQTTYYRLQ